MTLLVKKLMALKLFSVLNLVKLYAHVKNQIISNFLPIEYFIDIPKRGKHPVGAKALSCLISCNTP